MSFSFLSFLSFLLSIFRDMLFSEDMVGEVSALIVSGSVRNMIIGVCDSWGWSDE